MSDVSQMARRCVVVLGDIVGSRELRPARRAAVQQELREFIARANETWAASLLAPLEIREGDSLRSVWADPRRLPELFWGLDTLGAEARMRTGIGWGDIHTEGGSFPDDVDGPAFHRARVALIVTREAREPSTVFRGFGRTFNVVLTALATLLADRRGRLTLRQRQVIDLVRSGRKPGEAARDLGISAPTVSNHLRASSWAAYEQGEDAMRRVLARYRTSYDVGGAPAK